MADEAPPLTHARMTDRDTLLDIDQLQMQSGEYDSSPIKGEMDVVGGGAGGTGSGYDTLDEPVLTTLKRDLKAVGSKFMHVLYPRNNNALLRDWDLWGPLFLCVFISLLINWDSSGSAGSVARGPGFTEVFTIISVGSCAVTVNAKLLGGTISFFQSVCVLGYCLLCPAVALVVCKVVLLVEQTTLLFVLRLIVTCLGFGWATFASTAFLSGSHAANRKALTVYPVFLFYFVVSWLVISQTHYGH